MLFTGNTSDAFQSDLPAELGARGGDAAAGDLVNRAYAAAGSWEREQVSKRLGRHYQVVREIGHGAVGVVFLARDIALHRLVAIKVLRRECAASEEHRERFRREARMTARLSHPNIVPVHTFGEAGELVFIVMKYVDGESLAQRMRRTGVMSSDDARRVISELAGALDYAHREGVVHRDLKAENIVLERGSARPMLTDFGVALLRSLDPVPGESAHAFGTPHYMSPEQAAGELDIDGRSDLYSLGILGYYMLSGRLPFDAPTFEGLAAKHIAEPHVALEAIVPDAPPALVGAIERCLRKERGDRWRTGTELARAVLPKARRSWLRPGGARTAQVMGGRLTAELALFAAALRTLFGSGPTL